MLRLTPIESRPQTHDQQYPSTNNDIRSKSIIMPHQVTLTDAAQQFHRHLDFQKPFSQRISFEK